MYLRNTVKNEWVEMFTNLRGEAILSASGFFFFFLLNQLVALRQQINNGS